MWVQSAYVVSRFNNLFFTKLQFVITFYFQKRSALYSYVKYSRVQIIRVTFREPMNQNGCAPNETNYYYFKHTLLKEFCLSNSSHLLQFLPTMTLTVPSHSLLRQFMQLAKANYQIYSSSLRSMVNSCTTITSKNEKQSAPHWNLSINYFGKCQQCQKEIRLVNELPSCMNVVTDTSMIH